MFQGLRKAVEDAKKNLVKIPLNQSVPHEQKVNLVHVYLIPASHGHGLLLVELFVQF
jgi:ribosomal protein S5